MKKLIILSVILVNIFNLYAVKNVFILHSYSSFSAWTQRIHQGFMNRISTHGDSLLLTVEYLDFKGRYNALSFDDIHEYYNLKFKDYVPDLVFCSDDEALDFMLKYRALDKKNTLFSRDIPIVACGINFYNESLLSLYENLSIVKEEISLRDNIELAVRLLPESEKLYFLTDKSEYGDKITINIMNIMSEIKPKIDYEIISLGFVHELDSMKIDTDLKPIIFHLILQIKTDDNKLFSLAKIPYLLLEEIDYPIFTFWKDFLVPGIIGGKLINPYEQGVTAAILIEQILLKNMPSNSVKQTESPNRFYFDDSALKKFNIKKNTLPVGYNIINTPHIFKEYYKIINYLVITIIFISILVVILILENIKRNKIQEKLYQSKLLFDFVSDHTDEVIWLMNQDRKFFFLTPVAERKFGYSLDELKTVELERLLDNYPKVFHDKYLEAVDKLLSNEKNKESEDNVFKEEILRFELPIKTAYEDTVWGDITIKLLPGEEKGSFWVLGAIHDVTNIKKVQSELINTLKEKELLLKEVHHRVKNNLQIITTLIQLQHDKFYDKDWNDSLKDIQSRIQAISYIHQKIYSSNNFAFISFDEYIKEISYKLISLYTNKYIKIDFHMDKVNLPLEYCVSLAMVYHEVFTNAVKYSPRSLKVLDLSVNLYKEELNSFNTNTGIKHFSESKKKDEILYLIVKDKGDGFPDGFNLNEAKTIGLSLISNIVLNLNGKISAYNDQGAVVKIAIPLKGVQYA